MQIYIARDGQQTGPFSLDDVLGQLRSGTVKPTDLAWYAGAAGWQPISSIPQIAANMPRLAVQKPLEPSSGGIAPPLISEVTPGKQNKSKILTTLIISGVFGLVCLIATLFAVIEGMQRNHTPVALLVMGIFGAIAGLSLAAQMFGALRQKGPGDVCQFCNRRGPTIHVTLNRHVGAILLMFHRSLGGAFCKDCVAKTFWQYTLVTALLGWWGMMSFFITPIVLTNNVIAYARSFFISKSK